EIKSYTSWTSGCRTRSDDETYGRKDSISSDATIAHALQEKEVGDLAVVNTPAGEASWYVNAIEYVKP
ncbi:GreA/GreB family elongation factor, partial [Klebsiella pneumoniae]|nr:GreA/GreB family elongation factor [Klebsiella pneumoniae]